MANNLHGHHAGVAPTCLGRLTHLDIPTNQGTSRDCTAWDCGAVLVAPCTINSIHSTKSRVKIACRGLVGGCGGGVDISEAYFHIIQSPAALVMTSLQNPESSFATNTRAMHACSAMYTHAAYGIYVSSYVWCSMS